MPHWSHRAIQSKEDARFGEEQGTKKLFEPHGDLDDCSSLLGELSERAEMEEHPRSTGSVAFSWPHHQAPCPQSTQSSSPTSWVRWNTTSRAHHYCRMSPLLTPIFYTQWYGHRGCHGRQMKRIIRSFLKNYCLWKFKQTQNIICSFWHGWKALFPSVLLKYWSKTGFFAYNECKVGRQQLSSRIFILSTKELSKC